MTVIRCRTEEEAVRLFDEMRKYHPEYMGRWRDDGASSSWKLYRQETCYWPVKYDSGECLFDYCSRDFFKGSNCRILDFNEVVFDLLDYGEFDSGEIKILLGGDINV